MTDVSSNVNPEAAAPPLPPLFGFFIRFLIIQLVLFSLEMWKPVQEALIKPFTALLAAVSGQVMSLFDRNIGWDELVIYSHKTDFAIEVVAGCNGVEATIILFAGILAFRAPWKLKLWGMLWGFLAIHIINVVRIISLFYIGQWNLNVYEWAHLYIWQALILLDAIIIWLIWMRRLPLGGAHEASITQ